MASDEQITEDEHGQLVIKQPLISELRAMRRDQAEGFGRLEKAIEAKADKTDVDRVERKLDGHERRIEDLEKDKHDREERARVHQQRDALEAKRRTARWVTRRDVLSVVCGAAVAAGTVLAVVHP